MKRVWKYILSILLVLILGAAGTVYYFLNVKTYETADENIDEIMESDYDIDLPSVIGNESVPTTDNQDEVNSGSNPSDKTENGSPNNTSTNKGTKNSTNQNNVVNNPKSSTKNNQTSSKPSKSNSTSSNEPTEVTVKNIKDSYRPVFKSLESQANGKIDALVSRAINEYHQKKANGESISYSYFYQKYTSAGKSLESKTDNTFNYIYKALEKDLKKYGYSDSHAKVFKEQYEETKKARESALLNKAKEAL